MRRVKQGGYSEASGQAAKIVGQADVKFRQGPAMRAAALRFAQAACLSDLVGSSISGIAAAQVTFHRLC